MQFQGKYETWPVSGTTRIKKKIKKKGSSKVNVLQKDGNQRSRAGPSGVEWIRRKSVTAG